MRKNHPHALCSQVPRPTLNSSFAGDVSPRHRVVRKSRAARIMELPLDYIFHPDFEHEDAAAKILVSMPLSAQETKKTRVPAGLPPYLASLYGHPLLTQAQEIYLFRKYNYLKYCANNLRNQLEPARPKTRLMNEIQQIYTQIVETKNQIIRANLRLVVSIARKYAGPSEDFFDLISDGNISLMKAVEKFDVGRGFKFSTYATWAIRRNFAREFATRMRRADRFHTSREELLEATTDKRSNVYEQELKQQRRRLDVGRILRCLNERERDIIMKRFGLNSRLNSRTLKEVGDELGVSKERVRQLEARALAKLHHAAESERIETP